METGSSIKVIQGDCVEVMRGVSDNSIDFVLTDPPFNVNLKYNSIDDNLSDSNYSAWCLSWIKELKRILKPNHYGVIFTGDKKSFWVFKALQESGLTFHHFLKWYKPNCKRALSGTVLFGRTELAFVFSKDKPNVKLVNHKVLYQDTLIFQNTLPTDIDAENHNARRPIALYEQIIDGFTQKNDTVLDCFLGSGTTALACQNLDRNFIGIEIDPKYVEIINRRLLENQKSKPLDLENF